MIKFTNSSVISIPLLKSSSEFFLIDYCVCVCVCFFFLALKVFFGFPHMPFISLLRFSLLLFVSSMFIVIFL